MPWMGVRRGWGVLPVPRIRPIARIFSSTSFLNMGPLSVALRIPGSPVETAGAIVGLTVVPVAVAIIVSAMQSVPGLRVIAEMEGPVAVRTGIRTWVVIPGNP